jgi:hypothetical protein
MVGLKGKENDERRMMRGGRGKNGGRWKIEEMGDGRWKGNGKWEGGGNANANEKRPRRKRSVV